MGDKGDTVSPSGSATFKRCFKAIDDIRQGDRLRESGKKNARIKLGGVLIRKWRHARNIALRCHNRCLVGKVFRPSAGRPALRPIRHAERVSASSVRHPRSSREARTIRLALLWR